MIFKKSYSFIHLESTCSAWTFFFFSWCKSSLWTFNWTIFSLFCKVIHNLLLDLLFPMRFYQLYQFFLLVIRSIVCKYFRIMICWLIFMNKCGRNCISWYIMMLCMTVIGAWPTLDRFVHSPWKINFIFGHNCMRRGLRLKPSIFLPLGWRESLSKYQDIVICNCIWL